MAKTLTTRYDVTEHLRIPEERAAYFEACLEEAHGDATFIAKALGDIARAKGMTQVASDAGLSSSVSCRSASFFPLYQRNRGCRDTNVIDSFVPPDP